MQNEEINNNNNIESNEVPQAEQQTDTGENVEVAEASNENAPISEENNNENVADIQQADQAKLDNEAFAKMRVENARLQKELEEEDLGKMMRKEKHIEKKMLKGREN